MIKEIKFRDYFHYLPLPYIPPPPLLPLSLTFTFKLAELNLINFFYSFVFQLIGVRPSIAATMLDTS